MNRALLRLLGYVVVVVICAVIIFRSIPILFYREFPHTPFFARCFYILLLSMFICLLRLLRGPTPADRAVAIDILGILIVGICALLGIPTSRGWYIDIGIAWALQSFIATIALAKFIEGKDLDS